MSTKSGELLASVRYALDDGTPKSFGQAPPDDHVVRLHDMRGHPDQPTLEREGFTLLPHRSSVVDFQDPAAIANVYIPEIADLFRSITGSSTLVMQDNWVLRGEDRSAFKHTPVGGGKVENQMRTGGFVHVDYDAAGAASWANYTLAKAGRSAPTDGRLLVLTAWRAFSAPPQDKPLACIDRRTAAPEDLIPEQIASPILNWNGFQVKHNPAHRWLWWSDMHRDEVLIFINHEDGVGLRAVVPHSAFGNPACPPGVATRQSIEVRGYIWV